MTFFYEFLKYEYNAIRFQCDASYTADEMLIYSYDMVWCWWHDDFLISFISSLCDLGVYFSHSSGTDPKLSDVFCAVRST